MTPTTGGAPCTSSSRNLLPLRLWQDPLQPWTPLQPSVWQSAFCDENYTVVIPEPQSRPEPVSMPPASDSFVPVDMPYCITCGCALKSPVPPRAECPRCSSKTYLENRSKRSLGIELEFIYEYGMGLNDLYYWGNFHDDGSITNFSEDESPTEFASAILCGDQVPRCIDTLHFSLAAAGARVNNSCGLHIHLGVEGDTHEQRSNIRNWWLALEPLLFHLVPQHRRVNTFCAPACRFASPGHSTSEWEDTRYVALNIAAYSEHGTYEVRLHQATTSATRMKLWCYFLLHFFDNLRNVDFTRTRAAAFNSLSNRGKLLFLFQNAKLPLSLRKELVRRERLYRYRTAPTRNLYLGKLPLQRQWEATSPTVPDNNIAS